VFLLFCIFSFPGSSAGYVDAFGENAKFNNPYLVAFDADGNVLVADCSNHRVRKVSQSGVVTTLAGNGRQGHVNGTGAVAEFDSPSGLCFDTSDGSVLVADHNNGVIRYAFCFCFCDCFSFAFTLTLTLTLTFAFAFAIDLTFYLFFTFTLPFTH
jgi:hypothetical protein